MELLEEDDLASEEDLDDLQKEQEELDCGGTHDVLPNNDQYEVDLLCSTKTKGATFPSGALCKLLG